MVSSLPGGERDRRRFSAIESVAAEVARPAAKAVDLAARFPRETLEALRAIGALGAAVPGQLGGGGAALPALAQDCQALGRGCASSAMVLATHHVQVLSIAAHRGRSRELGAYLTRVASEQRLIASATTECAHEREAPVLVDDHTFALAKRLPMLSYGAHADDLLLRARRGPDAADALILVLRGGFELSDQGSWDTLGLRGTCSPAVSVSAWGEDWQIVPEPFPELAERTITPVSLVLSGAVWLGIASDALDTAQVLFGRARHSESHNTCAAQRLEHSKLKLEWLRSEVFALASEHDALAAAQDHDHMPRAAFVARLHGFKHAASRTLIEIVSDAIALCGADGYRNDSEHGLGRHLRDAHSAVLMAQHHRSIPTGGELQLSQPCA